ncbi:MAG TPA: dipeptide/oligopeptide/nickel ABC transporter ATP-binding protein [Terriglobales bacterium]|jgi:ABC-type glutathione transport system ATPase component
MTSDLPTSQQSNSLLRVRKLSKSYVRGNLLRGRVPVEAAKDVHFEVDCAHTLAIIGASGSGKSTVARCIAGLERPDVGEVWIDGTDIAQLSFRELRPFRSVVQMIFQDAATSMNPRFSAAEVIEEPLLIQGQHREERRHIAETLMKKVGLSADWLDRSAAEFSGGQRQRLAIARALTLGPKLLVLDEAWCGLDLSMQAQIANLLLDLQTEHSLSYLLISHDLALVARMADTVAVMSHGQIVESGSTQQIISGPQHTETKKLLNSAKAAEYKPQLSKGASA